MKAALAIAVVALAGCDLYVSGGDDTVCNGYKDPAPAQQYRDPVSGTCIAIGYGGGACDCGECPEYDIAQPDYGLCVSSCSNLDESTCQATSGCYATYEQPAAGDGGMAFSGCWQTAPSGPIQGSCQGLDAQSCSRHDNCALDYDFYQAIDTPESYWQFLACIDEPIQQPPTCASTDCGAGYHCEDQCHPADGTSGPVMSWCQAACVPDTSSCSLIDCGRGYDCIESCEATPNDTLWCSSQCVPSGGGDPGACTGTITCGQPAPACPAGTTAGIANGCYTGYCIPNGQCTAAPCEALTTEAACSGRTDCSSVYTGTDCTCHVNGCTCQTLSFARCE